MWKRINWRAGALFALAFLLYLTGAVSGLTMAGLIALGGLESFIELVITYLRQPPSLERFRQLNMHAGGTWIGFAGAGLLFLNEARLGLDPKTLDRVSNIGNAAIVVGTIGHVLWLRFALRRALRARPSNPDFAEDEHGNPVRAE
jgi:hypothetical protein